MDIPFLAGAYDDYSSRINSQQCLNLVPFFDEQESIAAFYARPGLKSVSEVLAANPIRGLCEMGGDLWIVVGNKLYKRTTGGSNSEEGTLDTSSGTVCMVKGSNSRLLIVDGTSGYVVVSATFAKITDADFPASPTTCAYVDGYYIVTKGSTGDFYISSIDDPETWVATDYSTAEGSPDLLERAISVNNDLWLLGEKTFELWWNTGNATFPFERIRGGIAYIGTNSKWSAAVYNRTLYFLSDAGIVMAAKGIEPQRISTKQVEYNIQQYTTISDAIGFMIPYEGHLFYILTFPTASETWCYDVTTGIWSRWSSYTSDAYFRGVNYIYWNNKHIVGDHTNGKLLELDNATYQDDSNGITRRIATRKVALDGLHLTHHNLEVYLESGTGAISVTLEWSDDFGQNWTSGGAVTLANADYDAVARWRRLGKSKSRVYRVTTTSNAKIAFKAVASGDITPQLRRA